MDSKLTPSIVAVSIVGPFLYGPGVFCLKTEYGNNEGRIDAYIVSSGEFFWGDAPQTIESQRRQLVTPVEVIESTASRRGDGDGRNARRHAWVAKQFNQFYMDLWLMESRY